MQWPLPEGNFWDDEKLQRRLASRLDRWVSLMRMHGGAQAEMIASAPEEIRDLFSKRIKLMAPLLKAWKGALKEENAVDFSGLIHQAIVILEKGRFISPWKHILVDEFQDISPQRAALLRRCANKIRIPRCLPLAMTGRRFTVSAGRSSL
ncbi:DNA helicase IV [Citrobacter koseri]|nr:DNA helicase IV [Citrobacter koseri]